jgi:transposase-like protein
MTDLSAPMFNDEAAARAYFEGIRWPNGPVCPRCGEAERVTRMEGKSHRPGLFQCNACREPFSVTVGMVMERSHIPLHKWAAAFHLMAASKKGMSANQLGRMLGLSHKSAWFLAHRIREAMADPKPAPLGGEGKVVEADETYFGKAENAAAVRKRYTQPTKGGRSGPGGKRPIVALVERGGEARAFHMPKVTAENVREALVRHADRRSRLQTDESNLYPKVGAEYAAHETVKHSAGEYVRGPKGPGRIHTNNAEGFFGVFKRGMRGVYQHCGEQHMQRYLDEFAFRFNNRVRLGVNDAERARLAVRGADGKRLLYRGPDAAPDA